MSENFKVGDMVVYNDPDDPVGATGAYYIKEISGEKVTLMPMCGRLQKIHTTTKHLER
jgi:hypothetical protein